MSVSILTYLEQEVGTYELAQSTMLTSNMIFSWGTICFLPFCLRLISPNLQCLA